MIDVAPAENTIHITGDEFGTLLKFNVIIYALFIFAIVALIIHETLSGIYHLEMVYARRSLDSGVRTFREMLEGIQFVV